MKVSTISKLLSLLWIAGCGNALTVEPRTRREALGWMGGLVATVIAQPALAAGDTPDEFDVDSYIRTGLVTQPMGVSGQAGKSRPETGVVLRDGSEVFRDPRTGDVLAEILLKSPRSDMMPVLASYSSPWPLATGPVYDVECRDSSSGDAVFLAVSNPIGGKSLDAIKDSFFVNQLTGPTSRFSFYGQPTDLKVKNSVILANNKYRQFDLSFSTLSQSTQSEIPRRARVIVTVPEGTDQAVMLVASASANRWKKGSDKTLATVIDSFQAIPAPQTGLKVRAKERRASL